MRCNQVGGWGDPGGADLSLPEPLEPPGWQPRPGAGMCLTRGGRGGEGFGLQLGVGLWAQRPGCAGAPSQFESSGGAAGFQSSPGTSIVKRCPPLPRRTAHSYPAAGARAAARGLRLGPPPPPRGRRSPRAGCTLRFLPRRLPARLSGPLLPVPSLLSLSPPPPCVHSACYWKSPPDPRASRCQEVNLGQRISGQRILSIRVRIAAAAAARRPREGASGSPSAASEAERRPGLEGSRLVASSGFSPPPPQGKEPPLGPTRLKLRRQRAAG